MMVSESRAPPLSSWSISEFDRVLKSRKIHNIEEIQPDRISLGEAIAEIARKLGAGKHLPFEDLFAVEDGQAIGRHRLVVTFLAVLEMTRLRLIRVVQESEQSSLLLIGTEALLGPIEAMVDEGGYGD